MRLSKKEKTKKLIQYAKSVLHNPKHRKNLQLLMQNLGITEEEVIGKYIYYDLDIYAYSNEVFEPLVMRLVLHLHNLLEGSWHQDRQKIICEYIKLIQPDTLIDIGFGEPGLYVKQALDNGQPKITLCDMCDSAFVFTEALLNQWCSDWQNLVTFKKADMEDFEFLGQFDVCLFQTYFINFILTPKQQFNFCTKTINPWVLLKNGC